MRCGDRSRPLRRPELWLGLLIGLLLLVSGLQDALADVPVTLRESYAGPLGIAGTGGTLRLRPNTLDACAVTSAGSADLAPLPAGSEVVAAHLFWAGSWSTATGSSQTQPDWDVSLQGQALGAEQRCTAQYRTGGVSYDFFQGQADVTAIVASQGGGRYDFAGLSVNDAAPHCAVQAVLAGWSLMVVYRAPGEPLRVVNLYAGLQALRGRQVTLYPDNFRIPQSGRDGRLAVLAWEGDEENSGVFSGVRETLRFNRRPLRDRLNPRNNPWNSTVNWTGDARSYGVDFDVFDVGARLRPGDESAAAAFSVGGDLVLLGAELLAVTNTPVADLALGLQALGAFPRGGEGELRLDLGNLGPGAADDAELSLVLPTGLSAVASAAPGWTYDDSGAPRLVWRRATPLPAGETAPPATLRVAVAPDAAASLTLLARVTSGTFDNVAANDQATLVVTPGGALPDLLLVKSARVVADPTGGAHPKAIPGALVDYSLQLSNQGPGETDAGTLVFVDALPADMALFVGDLAGGAPLQFVDGLPPSGLSFHFGALGDPADDLEFSADGGTSYAYTPSPDAEGFDAAVTHLRVRPGGRFLAAGGSAPAAPSCTLRFRARLH